MAIHRALVAAGVLTALACTEPPHLTAPEGSTAPVPVAAAAAGFVPNCGFASGDACPILDSGPRCDHGLQLDNRGTPLPGDDRCVNDTRHLVGAGFRGGWTDWALANQRTLAVDEPLNWVQFLTTHNAFNNIADQLGVLDANEVMDPNQVWSISDQLDLGSRMLWLDPHWTFGAVRLCHAFVATGPNFPGPELHPGCLARDRRFAYAIREIADWLAANPDEIVVIDLEAYVEEHFDDVSEPLETFFGAMLYDDADRPDDATPWPSRRELLAGGKRVIVGALGGNIDPAYYVGDNFGGTTHNNYIDGHLHGRYIKHFAVERTDGIVTRCVSNADSPPKALQVADNVFRTVGEDRTTLSLSLPVGHEWHVGVADAVDVADLAACGVFQVSLDMLGADLADDIGRPIVPDYLEHPDRVPEEERQSHLVWSWRPGDRGGAGDAALLHGSDGRWSSETPSQEHRFACARPRSETSRNIADWTDSLATEWRVTSRAGAWTTGGRACLDEYGAEGFVFSVPVHGLANGRLRLADAQRGDVWLAYNDIKQEGSWIIDRRPTAHAGADRVVECNGHGGTPVRLDGGLSSDPDGDPLAWEWSGPFGTAAGAQPTVLLPLGRHVIRLVVDDGFGGVDEDEVVIEVIDTTAPEIRSASASPAELWPPNHKMVPVTITVDVHDACDAAPACRITSVTSDEPVNDVGDGDTAPDWRITGALTVELRAERAGPRDGRIYTIAIECVDASGNRSTTQLTVPVPHDRR
ncbi:MAG TPA: hypothetical protein VFZ11_02790 [Gemmatimonadaceae bacterium]